MLHTEEDKKLVDHRLLRADGIADGKSKLFPHISLAHKLEHLVWFSSLNSFLLQLWVVAMFQGSAPDSCTTWQGRWAGEGSRDASGSQWAAVLPQKALCMLGAFPSCAIWGTNAAQELWRNGKRTGSTSASAITPYGCLWNWRAGFGDPGPPCPSYKRGMVFRYGRCSRAKLSSSWMLNAVTAWEAHLTW